MHTLYIQVERAGKKKCDRKLRRWSSESFFDIPCLIAVYNRHRAYDNDRLLDSSFQDWRETFILSARKKGNDSSRMNWRKDYEVTTKGKEKLCNYRCFRIFNRTSRLNLAQYFFLLQRRIPNTNVFSLAFSKEEEERLCKAIESFLFSPNNTSPFSSIRQSLSLRSVYFNVASTLDPTTLLPRWRNFFKPPTCRHSSIQLPV